jgi:uncharacterized protein (TIGR02145 family)
MAMMFAWTLNAQVDTIVTASGELGNSGSDLEFLNESGGLTRFPRLSDAGELLYYPPLVTTDSVTNITSTSAAVYGNILFNGWYENVQEQGFQLSTTADFSGSVTAQAITPDNPYADCELPCMENVYSFIFTGLSSITTYYVRAYATNEHGTAYGDTLPFTTLFGCGISTVQDYDGNVYNTVQIGSQCWTKENLKTTHYTNGTAIPLGSTTSTTVAYRYNPNNDAANVATYGYLYNWPAVMNGETPSNAIPSGVQGICPNGWHVPSDREFQEMEFAVGMSASDTVRQQFRGNIVSRLCGNTGWSSSSVANAAGNISTENRNSTDFNACPAGYYNAGSSTGFGQEAEYWTATMYNSDSSFRRDCIYTNVGINRTAFNKNRGFSVRCVHDTPVPLGELPLVTTNIVTDITSTTATCGGNVVYEGSSAVTARGVCWSTSQNPTVGDSHTEDGNGQGSFVSTLTNLTAGTTYYVRTYAINCTDTAYGEEVSFTAIKVPTVTTTAISSIASTTATSGGNVTDDGGATVTARGVCWSTSHNPTTSNSKTTNGTGIGSFTSSLTGLTAGTTYYVRAYATNSAGTEYGNEVSFTTTIPDGSSCGTCRDYDGNNYSTVQIGNQCWMKSNLRTKHYADGTAIQAYVQGNPSTPYTTPYYYSFKYAVSGSALNASTYGYGYNGTAVMKNASSSNSNPSGVQGICPNGWHLPSRAEWNQLINYVQSQSQYLCGTSGIAAALATSGWGDPGSSHTCSVGRNANNATGFSARPTDYTSVCSPYCYDYGYRTYFVTSTLNGQYNYCVKILDTSVNPSFVSDASGGAVRCVKD